MPSFKARGVAMARTRWYGVAAIPNQCSICGKFRSWDDLETTFVPDTDFSSEDESYRECRFCLDGRDLVLKK